MKLGKYGFAAGVAMFVATAFASPSLAADGTINITGTVTATTCTINGGSTVNVPLPSVSTSALSADGTVAGRTPFSITLTGCTGPATTASTHFESGANTDNALHRLKNTGGGPATVGVQLLNSAQQLVRLGNAAGAQNSSTATITAGGATLNYYAEYIANGGPAAAGAVSTSTAFSLTYM